MLAGGASRRYGKDKARALWRGQTFTAHVVEAMRASGFRPIFVVGGGEADIPVGASYLCDRWPGEGPLGAAITALIAHRGDVVVAPCDMVRITAGTLLRLVEFAGPEPVVIPIWRDRMQPLCALYRPAALVSLYEDFAAGERSLVNALAHLPLCEINFDAQDPAFCNINTPRDYAQWLASVPPPNSASH